MSGEGWGRDFQILFELTQDDVRIRTQGLGAVAEDLEQDIYMAVLAAWDRVPKGPAPSRRAFVSKIARDVVASYFRRTGAKRRGASYAHSHRVDLVPDRPGSCEFQAECDEFLDSLPAASREIAYRILEGYGERAAHREHGISARQYRKVKTLLRKEFGDRVEDERQ